MGRDLDPTHYPGRTGLRDAAAFLPVVVYGVGGGLEPGDGSGGGGQRLNVRDYLVTVELNHSQEGGFSATFCQAQVQVPGQVQKVQKIQGLRTKDLDLG